MRPRMTALIVAVAILLLSASTGLAAGNAAQTPMTLMNDVVVTTPATLTPPIPPNALDAACVETGGSIRCTYQQAFPAEAAPHVFIDCGSVLVVEQGSGTSAAVTRTYDLTGNLIEEVRQVSYSGVLSTATEPTGIGTREGRFTATIAYQDGMITSITYTGLTAKVVIDGQTVALDAGRVVAAPTGTGGFAVLSASGRHDFIFPGLFGPGLQPQTPSPPNTQAICDAVT